MPFATTPGPLVASPQSMTQVWESLLPASVIDAATLTVAPTENVEASAGLVMDTAGFAFATVSVVVDVTTALCPSFTDNVRVNEPSSLQVTLVLSAFALPNVHADPGSVPAPAVADHVVVNGSLS